MRFSVERLRRWIVILAVLLFAVLLGFLIFARARFRHIAKDLPGRLGVNIQQTANGFTYSQSSQGHTVFTIHASKLLQYKSGHALLHDCSITLYGPPGSGRTDHIYSADFDYDPNSGIAATQGQVEIDLQGPSPEQAPGNTPPATQPHAGTIHIKTTGLTFNQKTGSAVTSQLVAFQFPKADGTSVGADYNSKSGVLVLQQQVVLNTDSNGKPAVIHASHATLLRASHQAFLLNATSDYQGEKSSADQAILYFRPDGSASQVDAQGHVHIVTSTGAVITSQTGQTYLNAQSQPTQANLGGGVNLVSNTDAESMHGNAVEGTLTFGPNSVLQHAQFRTAVSFVDQRLSIPGDQYGKSTRQVIASKVDIAFSPGPDGKAAVARKALANGNPVVTLRDIPSKGPEQDTVISGDQLLATLKDGKELQQLDGSGHTAVKQVSQSGASNTTHGDTLHVTFATAPAQAPAAKRQASAPLTDPAQIDTAVQDGNVVLTQTPAPAPGKPAPATLTAWAAHAEYHGSDEILHLTGDPHLNDGAGMQLSAQLIDYNRGSGDSEAKGSLRGTYTQQKQGTAPAAAGATPQLGGDGPVHVLAERALFHHDTNVADFFGAGHTPVRMWQSANSVWAPVIELSKKDSTLEAHGDAGSTAAVVNANFLSAMGPKHQQSVVRVHSRTLVYSDTEHKADFRGAVVAEEPDGTIHSDQAVLYFTPAAKNPSGNAAQASSRTQLDHMVATGHVVITQPGRRGEGESLVYTAADGKYVLTGKPGAPPHVFDQAHGTTTGAALIFTSQNDSVEVSGGKASAVTETRAPR